MIMAEQSNKTAGRIVLGFGALMGLFGQRQH
jgi:hypothetical protein